MPVVEARPRLLSRHVAHVLRQVGLERRARRDPRHRRSPSTACRTPSNGQPARQPLLGPERHAVEDRVAVPANRRDVRQLRDRPARADRARARLGHVAHRRAVGADDRRAEEAHLDHRRRRDLALHRDRVVLRVLGPEIPVHRAAADGAVGRGRAARWTMFCVGCTASAAAVTVFAKKNGSVEASACWTL